MAQNEILAAAEQLIWGDRQEDYGDASQSFGRIAKFWTAYLGAPVNSQDVANMMILMKVSRLVTSPGKKDSYIDIAGYAALGADIEKV